MADFITDNITVLCGDWLQRAKEIPDKSVQACVTSPPYFGLRDYGCEGQIGLEATPQAFVEKMVQVFAEVWRILRDDAVLFLNLGDSYASSPPGCAKEGVSRSSTLHGVVSEKYRDTLRSSVGKKRNTVTGGLKPKDLCGIPWRVAFAVQEWGWYLRSDLPWVKRSAMPESVTDRPAKAIEYFFLLTKAEHYFFDMEAIKLKAAYAGEGRGGSTNRYEQNDAGMDSKEYAMRNFRNSDLWFQSLNPPHGVVACGDEIVGLDINPAPYKGAHFATFPPGLITPLIRAGTSERGCCPACGSPWVRVVERESFGKAHSNTKFDETMQGGPLSGSRQAYRAHGMEGPPPVKTLGWQPTCECIDEEKTAQSCGPDIIPEAVPCTVLDPFTGSGTTAEVAQKNGCRFVGCELNPEYIELIKKRFKQGWLFS